MKNLLKIKASTITGEVISYLASRDTNAVLLNFKERGEAGSRSQTFLDLQMHTPGAI